MKTIEEIRRDWIEALIAKFGSIAALNEAVGRTRTDATFSQLRNQSPDSKTGRPRIMGSDLARDTEAALGIEPGTFDHPPPGSGQPAEVTDLVRTVTTLTASGKLAPAEIRAMTEMLKARD
jgi:hypothetical protein